MEPISFRELCPAPAEFHLAKTGKTYRLQPVSIEDFAWMRETFGDELQKILQEVRPPEICRIVMRIMHPEDKEDFTARDWKFQDEQTGEVSVRRIGGANLLRHLVAGLPEIVGIYEALMKTIGVSQVLVDKLEAAEDENKKKAMAQESPGDASERVSIL